MGIVRRDIEKYLGQPVEAIDPRYEKMSDKELVQAMYDADSSTGDFQGSYGEYWGMLKSALYPGPDLQGSVEQGLDKVASELSGVDRFLVGAGESLNRGAGRVSGLYADVAEHYGGGDRAKEFSEAAERRNDISERVGGWAAGLGRAAPAFATLPLSGGALTQIPVGIASGALFSGDTAGQGATYGALGALAGQLLGGGTGRFINQARGNWRERAIQGVDDLSDDMRLFQKMGGRFEAGSAAGPQGAAPWTQGWDKARRWSPITAGYAKALHRKNVGVGTQAALRSMGATGDDVGRTVMRQIDDVIGREFDDVAAKAGEFDISPGVLNSVKKWVGGVFDDYKVTNWSTKDGFKRLTGSPKLPGSTYTRIHSDLTDLVRKSDSWHDIKAIMKVIDDLDDAAQRNAPADFLEQYAKVREKYKIILALDRDGVVKDGIINWKAFDDALGKIFGKAYKRGYSTLAPETHEVLTAARVLSSERVPVPQQGIGALPWIAGMIAGGGGLGGVPGGILTALGVGGTWLAPRMGGAASMPFVTQLGATAGRGAASMIPHDPVRYGEDVLNNVR